jgi:hypothetical protein
MSGERARTALNLTPVRGEWRKVLSKLCVSLVNHDRLTSVPETGLWLTVNPDERLISKREAAILLENVTMRDDAVGQERWLQVAINVRIGRDRFNVKMFLRKLNGNRITVELQLPSYVYESVYQWDPDEREIDEAVKFDLIQFCVDTSAAVGAEGFGYGFTVVDKVLGPPRIRSLEQWVGFNRPDDFTERWILAGVLTSRLSVAQLRSGHKLYPYVFERGGFTIYDLLWPSVLND